MKTTLALASLLVLAASGVALAGMEHDHAAPAAAKSPAFDTLKSLEGTWTGKADGGDGKPFDTTVIYKLIGGGTTLEERLFAGTPHEMVTMYHMDGDDVVLTHYCAAGNQPRMKLAKSDGKVFVFDFAGGTNVKADGMHMHAARLTLVDADHLKAEWTAWAGGKADHTAVFDLSRKK